ncbi:Mate efflux family protein [Seminavis robusta]|uniref:Mate efflux family protein n=1 Tax=Seminavis robusta TaxID=568900 RepID=A0A9N8ENX8_9STRA|nr:Mate efflux family protein [Seminavis robusta]|eukprot:Sro1341_g264510.1 Mate efflux family protein (158) ;mRNA; r:25064-25537
MTYKPSTTIVLALLLSLSVAVLGSALPHPTQFPCPRRTFSTQNTRYPVAKSSRDDVLGNDDNKENSQEDGVADPKETIRGGASTVSLPAKPPADPTFGDIRKFALPCLALWVSGPLLSLVDTSFVGLSGSAAESAKQLAALGPATTFLMVLPTCLPF